MSLTVSNSNVFSQNTVNKTEMYNKTKVSNVFDSNAENKAVTSPDANQEEFWPIVAGLVIGAIGVSIKSCSDPKKYKTEMQIMPNYEWEAKWKAAHDKKRALFDIPTIRVLEHELNRLSNEIDSKRSEAKNFADLIKKNEEYDIGYNVNAVKSRLKKLQKDISELELQYQKTCEELDKVVTSIYENTAEERASIKMEVPDLLESGSYRVIVTERYSGSDAIKYYDSSKDKNSMIW